MRLLVSASLTTDGLKTKKENERMEYPIDNFEIAKSDLLMFDGDGEFYMVLVLKRRKDTKFSGKE